MRRAINIIGPAVTLTLLILLFLFKDKLSETVSESIRAQAGAMIKHDIAGFIDSAYKYDENGQQYSLTFLEFGAAGCSACKSMESVMSEISTKFPVQVNVVFVNVQSPENHNLMLYYGIASIPTQILLDRQGREYFRHTGYISVTDLSKEFNLFKK